MPDDPTNPPAVEPTTQPYIQSLIDQATADLSRRAGLPIDDIEFLSFELKEWSDTSLGCPQPGMAYAQVPQDGYLILLGAGGQIYNYHGSGSGEPFLCEQALPVKMTKQPPLTLKGTPTISVPPPRE